MNSDDDSDIGPSPFPSKASADTLLLIPILAQLPEAEMYEKSWMHRDRISHIVCTGNETQFIITASVDGQIKFWKISSGGGVLEFVKTFNAHRSAPTGLACSSDGEQLVSSCTSQDEKVLRFYLVRTFDMVSATIIEDSFQPGVVCFVSRAGAPKTLICAADMQSPQMRIYDTTNSEPLKIIKNHSSPVVALSYNPYLRIAVSADHTGVINMFACPDCAGEEEWQFPNKRIATAIKFKTDTDLYNLAKKGSVPCSISMSRTKFAITSSDFIVRVFAIASGKIINSFDETFVNKDGIEEGDLQQRIERETAYVHTIKTKPSHSISLPQALLDQSGRILLFTTMTGIEMVDLNTNQTIRTLGLVEAGERFTGMVLFQGQTGSDHQIQRSIAAANSDMKKQELAQPQNNVLTDCNPLVVCLAFERDRLYAFTRQEPPDEGRDVFNEKSSKRQQMEQLESENAKRAAGLPKSVTLHTTQGDIELKLFALECPKTVENFIGLCKKGYYDNVLFHRVIRGFMVQTGDPKGDGTGGESLWGGTFQDEIVPGLLHDQPYTLSMANCGKSTNGSQFFITTVPTPHLDGKHTVFGRVVRGQDTVQRIEGVKTDGKDRPVVDVKIINVTTG